jgi:hypothetical protein
MTGDVLSCRRAAAAARSAAAANGPAACAGPAHTARDTLVRRSTTVRQSRPRSTTARRSRHRPARLRASGVPRRCQPGPPPASAGPPARAGPARAPRGTLVRRSTTVRQSRPRSTTARQSRGAVAIPCARAVSLAGRPAGSCRAAARAGPARASRRGLTHGSTRVRQSRPCSTTTARGTRRSRCHGDLSRRQPPPPLATDRDRVRVMISAAARKSDYATPMARACSPIECVCTARAQAAPASGGTRRSRCHLTLPSNINDSDTHCNDSITTINGQSMRRVRITWSDSAAAAPTTQPGCRRCTGSSCSGLIFDRP